MEKNSDCRSHLSGADCSPRTGDPPSGSLADATPGAKSRGAAGEVRIGDFLGLLNAQIRKTLAGNPEEFDALQSMCLELERETHRQGCVVPQSKPVVAYWETALEAIRVGPSASLYGFLKALSPSLRWMQSPHYRPDNCSQAFLQNYAYSELIGPDGLCASRTVSMGLLLLGPTTYYPPHSHPAAEWLYVLSGRGTWHLDNGPTISLPPGAAVFIPYGHVHDFWSMDTPMAAIYLCSGDVATYPTMLSSSTVGP